MSLKNKTLKAKYFNKNENVDYALSSLRIWLLMCCTQFQVFHCKYFYLISKFLFFNEKTIHNNNWLAFILLLLITKTYTHRHYTY